jgi:hypothetical protein
MINGELFGCNGWYQISFDILDHDGIIYDGYKYKKNINIMSRSVGTDECKCKSMVKILEKKQSYLKKYVAYLEDKCNKLADLSCMSHVKHFNYDEQYSAKRFKLSNNREIFYAILCACIKVGLRIKYNDTDIHKNFAVNSEIHKTKSCPHRGIKVYGQPDKASDKHESALISTTDSNNELYKFCVSEKGRWLMLTDMYDSACIEAMKASLHDRKFDIKIDFF